MRATMIELPLEFPFPALKAFHIKEDFSLPNEMLVVFQFLFGFFRLAIAIHPLLL